MLAVATTGLFDSSYRYHRLVPRHPPFEAAQMYRRDA